MGEARYAFQRVRENVSSAGTEVSSEIEEFISGVRRIRAIS
jgi:hypothetical protein